MVGPLSYMLPASIKSARLATWPYVSCVVMRSPFDSVLICTVGVGRLRAGARRGSPGGSVTSGSAASGDGDDAGAAGGAPSVVR